jgi:RecA-family ATPase
MNELVSPPPGAENFITITRREAFSPPVLDAINTEVARQLAEAPSAPRPNGANSSIEPCLARHGVQSEGENKEVELPVISAASFAGKDVPLRRWIVPDMIPDRSVTQVSGDGGEGKTTLMLQLAVAVATGRPWLGKTPDQAPVLFLSAEDETDELHRRLAAISGRFAVNFSDLGDLNLVPLVGKDTVMAAPRGKLGILSATAVWDGFLSVVVRLRPRLIILDALADVFGGEENARVQGRQFVGLVRGLAINNDLAVVLIAHPSLTGMSSGSGTSGSTAWNNSIRSRLYLERIKGDGIDPDLRILTVKKANYGPVGLELRLRWSNDSFILDGPLRASTSSPPTQRPTASFSTC